MASLKTLLSFDGTNGDYPFGSLIVDASGNLFGTTENGGANGDGTVFEIAKTATGYATTPTILVSFNGTDGSNPLSNLITDASGNLFGTTTHGGVNNQGTVFEIAKTATGYASTSTVLVSFNGTDGAEPDQTLFADASGNLFGTTDEGGGGEGEEYAVTGNGTAFEIAKTAGGYSDTPTELVSIDSDGEIPGVLTSDASGNLFGTTSNGGVYGYGSVFEIFKTANGYAATQTVLLSFTYSAQSPLYSSLIVDASGNLFGTTASGGVYGGGAVSEIAKTATGYASAPVLLASFNATTGSGLYTSLIVDSVGDLFGTTARGGANDGGTVFEIAKTATGYASTPTVLASMDAANRINSTSSLIADAFGDLFATTTYGGANTQGTVIEVTDSGFVTCYCSGTRILTARGDVAVEDLQVGDLVVTYLGRSDFLSTIRWLGHRTLDCRRHPRQAEANPIRIARHAFGENKPTQDLYVSPAHCIYVDRQGGVLIPASALANGSTITQVEADHVTYWHVELDSHDILIANGLPAESYIDMGNRQFFVENGIVSLDASPDAGRLRTPADVCRPFVTDGPVLEAVRAELRLRAAALGWTLAHAPLADLHLEVAGIRIDPVVRGLFARFTVPACAGDIWLVSSRSRPADVTGGEDGRYLGVCLAGLTIDDGFGNASTIALDDPLLSTGFNLFEEAWRWTAGHAYLPAALWDQHQDGFFLRVQLTSPALPHWVKSPARPASQLENREVPSA